MAAELSRLQSPAAIQAALDEYVRLGRAAFLERYGFGKSRDYLVRDPRSGELCDSKAIVGAAFGYQYPGIGPLRPEQFSGGEATVVPKLRNLGFEVVRIGEDWSSGEVEATVASYFEMLRLEAQQVSYKKTEFNAALRTKLNGRSKASIELKFQNISAVLHGLELPFIAGYKPRGNSQLLLRKSVQSYVLAHTDDVKVVVDALEDVRSPGSRPFKAVLVAPPELQVVGKSQAEQPRVRLPRKIDYAMRDESNRRLGRAGEQWAIGYEQQRLVEAGIPELFERLEWVADRFGDGAGYDILSYDSPSNPRYIEVKTTNGPHSSSFVVSKNELDFSHEAGESFFLYRVFHFGHSPCLYMLQGDVSRHVHLEPMDFRATFRRLVT